MIIEAARSARFPAFVKIRFPSMPPSSRFPRRLLAPGLLLLATFLAGGCSSDQNSNDAQATPSSPQTRVETLLLEPTSFTDVLQVNGTVEAIHDATLSAQVSGTVLSVAERGTQVEKGEPVAQLDSTEASAALDQARAQFQLARDRYQRQKPLFQDSIISALEFEQVRSQYRQAQASLSQTRERLRNTTVTAPFSGRVEERFVEPGEQVSPNQQVVRLVEVQPAKIAAGVPERYVGDVETGTTVEVSFRSTSVGTRTGRISFVGSTVDSESRTFPIEATLPNEDRMLKPEMVAQVNITRTEIGDALVLPRTAIQRDERGPHVYVVEQTESAPVVRDQNIALGAETGSRVQVDSGLVAGTEVIVSGQNNVSPGERVEIAQQFDRVSQAGTPFRSDTTTAPPTD